MKEGINNILTRTLLTMVWAYKKTLSPQTGVFRLLYYSPLITLQPGMTGCRREKTCSTYALEVLRIEPPKEAVFKILKRVRSCHA